ncbi:hypothetical protein NM688_g8078 [Phlebia brevispora]|uniref:Uncharacterized protein n=1 Tax=Phlebia brevispora TaxID=194682 RepID=A0ACC1RXL4_9APHY|nr:hypothetical protein NM688_g8078 [Phlebia brevispora]
MPRQCGKDGHWMSDCPENGAPSRGRSFNTQASANHTPATSGECFSCGQKGHWSSACPNGGGHARQAPADAECFKCHERGHYSNACPNGASGGKRKRGGSASSTRGAKRGRGGKTRGRGRGGKRKAASFSMDEDDWD